ncbi:MAG: TldD/PmbA family protein [Candidatus Latescibacteria bacterium]|nr:TldD/PmbA family protein [Candidatus Latescibacterota bacterium]
MSDMTLQAHPFGAWFGIDEATVARLLAEAMRYGAEFSDTYFQHTRSMAVTLEDGLISRASTGVDQGVGIRAVLGDQVGYAFSESLDLEPMLTAARTAATIASGVSGAPPQAIHPLNLPDRYRLDRDWEAVSVSERLPLLQKTEDAVRRMEPSVEKISISWNDSDQRVLVATSDGVFCADRRPMATLSCRVTLLKDGRRQSHGASVARREDIGWFTDERIRDLCRRAVENTRILFDARRPPAGEMPVVLAAGASGILLHEAIGHGLEADYNRKGTSIYATLLNQKVAPDFVTIVDDGTQPNDRGALNVDDEGAPAERTVLIEGGVLRSYLHDRISARHYGVTPTGSGRRESFRHVPMPRMRSTYMLDGPHTRDEIVAAVDRGIIAETFTNGQVQIGAGDFTFYIKNGWLIENGKITAPIKDVNIIGNGPRALQNVTMAAGDARLDESGWTCGKNGQGVPVSLGIPTVLVRSLTVGGVNA